MTGATRTTVYTDGACSGNPGPGGWGWVVPDGESAFGGDPATTNQRMELLAVLEAVRALPGPLHIVSDSTYVVNCFRDAWWKGWLKRGWKNSKKEPVKNRDLWEPLIDLYQERDLSFEWVKGHSGDRWNDRADELAVQGVGLVKTSADETLAAPPSPSSSSSSPESLNATAERAAVRADGVPGGRRIAVIGHRPPEIGGYGENPVADSVRNRLTEILSAKATMHADVMVLTGLQLGTETLAAEAALASGVAFTAVLAFPDPAARWPKDSQRRFDELIEHAAEVVILDTAVPRSAAEAGRSFGRRDQWLQRNADEAVVVFDGAHAGLRRTVSAFERALGDDVWVVDPGAV